MSAAYCSGACLGCGAQDPVGFANQGGFHCEHVARVSGGVVGLDGAQAGRWVALGGCVPLGVWNAAACVVRPHLCGTIHEAGVRPAPELASSIPVRALGGERRREPGAVEASAGRGRGPGGAGVCVHERPEWAGSALGWLRSASQEPWSRQLLPNPFCQFVWCPRMSPV